MALYLGSNKVGVTIPRTPNQLTGTVTSDSNGIVTFPELSFTPKIIALWNITKEDLKISAEEDGEEWDDTYARYVYVGSMLFAFYQDGLWISQGFMDNSGSVNISNASVSGGSCVSVNENIYSYRLGRYSSLLGDNIANTTFNYAIYG